MPTAPSTPQAPTEAQTFDLTNGADSPANSGTVYLDGKPVTYRKVIPRQDGPPAWIQAAAALLPADEGITVDELAQVYRVMRRWDREETTSLRSRARQRPIRRGRERRQACNQRSRGSRRGAATSSRAGPDSDSDLADSDEPPGGRPVGLALFGGPLRATSAGGAR
jgi:hypothetical protein